MSKTKCDICSEAILRVNKFAYPAEAVNISTIISFYFHLAVFFFLHSKIILYLDLPALPLVESGPVNNSDRILQTYLFITPFNKAC